MNLTQRKEDATMYQDAHTQAPGSTAGQPMPSAVTLSATDLSREDFDACIARGHALRAQACGEFGHWIAQMVQASWQKLRHGFTH